VSEPLLPPGGFFDLLPRLLRLLILEEQRERGDGESNGRDEGVRRVEVGRHLVRDPPDAETDGDNSEDQEQEFHFICGVAPHNLCLSRTRCGITRTTSGERARGRGGGTMRLQSTRAVSILS